MKHDLDLDLLVKAIGQRFGQPTAFVQLADQSVIVFFDGQRSPVLLTAAGEFVDLRDLLERSGTGTCPQAVSDGQPADRVTSHRRGPPTTDARLRRRARDLRAMRPRPRR
ncbi:MAG: hypothetical protein AB7P21_29985 [Lautropia sp.]